jgi:formylglycine-generating enzyme required for sulfatase activity/streptogramin lyase
MHMSRSFLTAAVLLILAGCTSKKDLGSLPDGGGESGGTGGAGPGGGGQGGQAGDASGAGGSGDSGGSTGVAGTAGGGTTGGAGAGGGGSGGSTGVSGMGGGGASGSSGGAGRGGTTGSAGIGAAGSGGTSGSAGTGGVAGTGGGAGGTVGSCIGAPNQTGRGPALITIPGGTFTFGAAGLSPANPPRAVPVDTFRIDRTLVTAAQFRECVQAGCCTLIPPPEACATNYSATPGARDNHPMNCVSLAEATAFCAWTGKEIPTEEQWEYAARGPGATPRSFPWGNVPPLWANSKLVDPSPVCSSYETTNPPTSQAGCPVGAHGPQGDTPEGVQDMAGNVRQWTTNCDNVNCVVKSDDVSSQFWYSAYRSTTGIQSHLLWLGFRCVRPSSSGTGGSTGTGGSGGAETHTITEFPLPTASQPSQITAGADGNVWFTENGDNKIGRITPAGTITEFPLAAASSRSRGVAAGTDGNIWFTGSGSVSVGVITPAGAITEFTPQYVSSANYVARGPATDSSIWYTDGFYVGRIATNGTPGNFVERHSIANGLGPLVSGLDLFTMWVAGGTGIDGRIYRVYTGGSSIWTVTEFMVSGSQGIYGITVGPDRNIWFTTTTDRIGRLTTSGTLTRFLLPNPNAAPYGIATGPDGNLWFTENTGNKIGRITPTGTITEFPVPTPNAGLRGITAGADGNLWFIEYTANKIGRITP